MRPIVVSCTTGIPATDEQLPDVGALTAEEVYAAYEFGSTDFHDLLAAHVETTIEALKVMPRQYSLRPCLRAFLVLLHRTM